MGVLTARRSALADALLDRGAVVFGATQQPPVTVNETVMTTDDLLLGAITEALLEVIEQQSSWLRFGYIASSEPQVHLTEALIEAYSEAGGLNHPEQLHLDHEVITDRLTLAARFGNGQRALLVTTVLRDRADTLIEIISDIGRTGLEVPAVLTVLDFNDRANSAIVGRSIVPLAPLSLKELLDHSRRQGVIDPDTYNTVLDWIRR